MDIRRYEEKERLGGSSDTGSGKSAGGSGKGTGASAGTGAGAGEGGEAASGSNQSTGTGTRRDGSGTKKLKFSYNEQREFDTIDEDIATLEDKIAEVEKAMAKETSNYTKLNELMAEKQKLESELEAKMDRWVYLNDLAEQIANQ